jgi:hypothetical protein
VAKRNKLSKPETPVIVQEVDEPKKKEQYKVEALDLVVGRFEAANNIHSQLEDKWKTWNGNFRSTLLDKDGYEFKSQIFVPVTEKIIRALSAKYLLAMFLRKPFFTLKPRTPADINHTKRLEALLTYVFDKMPDFFMNMVRFVQLMLIYGTAVGKVYWRDVKRVVGKDKKVEYIYSGPYFEPIDIGNFFIDPAATKLNGFYKIHRSYKTLNQLKAIKDKDGKQRYHHLDKVTSMVPNRSADDTVPSHRLDNRDLAEVPNQISEYDVVELLEYWAEDDSRVITVANRNTVIADEANPFWHGESPFVYATYQPLPFEFYGKGVCEALSSHQSMINTLTNEIMDNVRLTNNRMWKAVVNSVGANQIVSKAGKIIWVDDPAALEPLETAPIPTDAYRMLDRLNNDCEMWTAATSMSTAVGAPISKEQSATEVSILSRFGNEMHAMNIMLIEIPAITEIVRKAYGLIQQCATDEFALRVTDDLEGWDTFTPDDVALDVDIIPKLGVDVMGKETAQQNLVALMTLAKDIMPEYMPKLFDMFVQNLGYMKEEFVSDQPPQAPQAPAQPAPGGAPQYGTPGMPGNVGQLPATPAEGFIHPTEGMA